MKKQASAKRAATLPVGQFKVPLDEAVETLHAIYTGEVDALVVQGPQGPRVYTLKGSDQAYRLAIESMSEGMLTLSKDGTILYANAHLAKLVKLPLGQIQGTPVRTLIAPRSRALFDSLLREAPQTPHKTELELTASDGTRIPVYVSLTGLEHEDMSGVLMLVTDLTEQKRAQGIAASEELARAILEQAEEAIVVADTRGYVIRASSGARFLAAKNPEGQRIETVYPLEFHAGSLGPQAGEHLDSLLAMTIKGQKFRNVEATLRHPDPGARRGDPPAGQDPEARNVLVSASPLRGRQREIIGITLTLHDLTERLRTEQAMQQLNKELHKRTEEFEVANEELAAANEELLLANQELTRENAERRQAEEALRASEERRRASEQLLNDMIDTMPGLAFARDLQGKLLLLNRTLAQLWHVDKAEALGTTDYDFFPPDVADAFVAQNQIVIETGEPQANEEVLVEDGVLHTFVSHKFPLRDARGRIYGLGGVNIDITERKQAELEREELLRREQAARAQAEAAVRIRDTFITLASHELKTPLTSLKGYAELLKQRAESLSETDARMVQTIHQQTLRLEKMISGLLDISRIERGQLSIERGPVDLEKLLQSIVQDVLPTLRLHTLQVIPCTEKLIVEGDEARLEQVVQNLIQNAIKYSPTGGRISVRLTCDQGMAFIAVTDQGIGIPPASLPYLFTRFYRAENAEAHHINGLGVGLYVAREIVRLHDGDITVESELGKGSTFTVRLPLAK